MGGWWSRSYGSFWTLQGSGRSLALPEAGRTLVESAYRPPKALRYPLPLSAIPLSRISGIAIPKWKQNPAFFPREYIQPRTVPGQAPVCRGHRSDAPPTWGIDTHPLADGVNLHLHSSPLYKSTRIDIFLTAELRSPEATERALVARLLERGTSSLPDVRRLNCFLDDLYGAGFGVGVDKLGVSQVLHLNLEVIDSAYLPERQDLLGQGFRFLHDVLCDPKVEGNSSSFPEAVVAQERRALGKEIESVYSDKAAYAYRRCIETMCAGEPWGTAPHGRCEDLPLMKAPGLLASHREGLKKHGIDIYVSGGESPERVLPICEELFSWAREYVPHLPAVPTQSGSGVKEVVEEEEMQQGKLVCGYRTGVTVGDPAYPAILLLDLLLGGDLPSRLQRSLREERGLCYHVASFIEPLCGLWFVEASVDARDYGETRSQIESQLGTLADRGPSQEELEMAKAAALQRLQAMGGDRESLIRFHFLRRLAGASSLPAQLGEQLRSVAPGEIASMARNVAPDTIFFLSNRIAAAPG